MTTLKKDGGYGFRDLQSFNLAIRANMAAIVLSEPNTLWVRVLKCLYFLDNTFVQASLGSSASWGWAILLEGRDAIKDDGIWTLGDGQTIRPFQDPWVSFKQDF